MKYATAVGVLKFKFRFGDTPQTKPSFSDALRVLRTLKNALCNRPPNSSFCDTPRAKPSCLTYSWVHGEAHATAWHDFDIGRLRLVVGVQSDKRRVFARGVDEKHENASRIILGYLSAVSSFVGPKVVVSKARFRRTPQTKPPFWKTQLGYMCAVSSFGRSYFLRLQMLVFVALL